MMLKKLPWAAMRVYRYRRRENLLLGLALLGFVVVYVVAAWFL
jgi:hypothetical protein